MTRLARLDAPGVVHHVIIRGIERRKIFLDEKDCQDFVERLGDLLLDTGTKCYAWALLTNHAHFLLRTGQVGLADLMRRLLTGYAVRFNRRHRRHAHLFQNRYKSIVCQEVWDDTAWCRVCGQTRGEDHAGERPDAGGLVIYLWASP